MDNFETIQFEVKGKIGTVWLNRPEVHNAFNGQMVNELTACFEKITRENNLRVVLLRGRGKSFCSGADLNWMREVYNFTADENYKEGFRLAKCLFTIYTCTVPVISVLHGFVAGGANGLAAASDMSFCTTGTRISFREVKLGLIPAVISPYVLKRISESDAKYLMLTGKSITGDEAERLRLVNRTWPENEIEDNVKGVIDELLSAGPGAVKHCKRVVREVSDQMSLHMAMDFTARAITDARCSSEGQEGMAAYFEKRQPDWIE
jgi:methylglutaconyl-CoA hydratase